MKRRILSFNGAKIVVVIPFIPGNRKRLAMRQHKSTVSIVPLDKQG